MDGGLLLSSACGESVTSLCQLVRVPCGGDGFNVSHDLYSPLKVEGEGIFATGMMVVALKHGGKK